MIKLKIIPTVSEDYEEVIHGRELDNSSWWYLHGELERRVGYDKATIYNMSDLPEAEYPKTSDPKIPRMSKLEGIYPVEVYGVPEECVGYFWVREEREPQHWSQRGLVVLKSDLPGNRYALGRYEDRSSML